MPNRPRVWDENVLRSAIELAESAGIARVELPNADDAKRFRLRLYDYRRAENIGHGIVITLEDNFVILTRAVPSPSDIKIDVPNAN